MCACGAPTLSECIDTECCLRSQIIPHDVLFFDPSKDLPTYNPRAIESVLHRIPGISRLFLYFNRDVLLGRRVAFSDFKADRAFIQYEDGDRIDRTVCDQFTEHVAAALMGCLKHELYRDHTVSRQHWKQSVDHAPAHVPHLFDRDDMQELDRVLAYELQVTRTNRFHQRVMDIDVFVQQEARRRMLAAQGTGTHIHRIHVRKPALDIDIRTVFLQVKFETCDANLAKVFWNDLLQSVRPCACVYTHHFGPVALNSTSASDRDCACNLCLCSTAAAQMRTHPAAFVWMQDRHVKFIRTAEQINYSDDQCMQIHQVRCTHVSQSWSHLQSSVDLYMVSTLGS